MRALMSSALALVACKGDPPVSPSDSDAPPDSPAPLSVRGSLVSPEGLIAAPALQVGLVAVRFSEGPAWGDTLRAAPAAEAWSLELPRTAPPEALGALSQSLPEATGALYMPVVWEDLDGDGAFVEGEPIAAMQLDRLVVWVETTAEGLDWPPGWSAVDTGLSGAYAPNRCLRDTSEPLLWRMGEGYPRFEGLDLPPLTLRGLETRLSLGGAVLDPPVGATGVVGLPYQVFEGGPSDPIYDAPLEGGAFSAALEGPPDPSHYSGANPSWRVTWHLNLLYADLDGDGRFTFGEDDLEGSTTCVDGQRAYVRYTAPVFDWQGYRLLECYGGVAGWRPILVDPETGAVRYLDPDTPLDIDPSACRVDG